MKTFIVAVVYLIGGLLCSAWAAEALHLPAQSGVLTFLAAAFLVLLRVTIK